LLYAFSPGSFNKTTKNSFLDYSQCSLTESHIETVQNRVKVADGETANLSKFDILELTSFTEVYQVNRCVNSNNEVNTERILISSDKPVKEWKPQYGRVISNGSGVSVYNTNSKLIKSIPLSAKAAQSRSALATALSESTGGSRGRGNDAAVFPMKVSSAEVDTRVSESTENAKFSKSENGNLEISKTTQSGVSNRENVSLMELQSLGGENYAPRVTQERRYVTSPFSGVCLEYIQTTTFSTYSVNDEPLAGFDEGGRR